MHERFCSCALLLALILSLAPDLLSQDYSGTYMADDGAIYYVQQSGNLLWWAGMSLDPNLQADLQFHRGLQFTNVFRGTISNNEVTGEWSDVSRGVSLNFGVLDLL